MQSLLVLSLLATIEIAVSVPHDPYNICVGPYALCSGSPCVAINSTYASCTCQGPFNGLNIAKTATCKDRADALISTYSIETLFTNPRQPKIYGFTCSGDNAGPFAECLDAPCTTVSGSIVCTCPMTTGDHLYGGEICPANVDETKKLCKSLFSTSAASTNSSSPDKKNASDDILSAFYAYPPKSHECNAPGASGKD